MSYFPLPSKPFKPGFKSSHLLRLSQRYFTERRVYRSWYPSTLYLVDLGGLEPPSEQHILGHAKILVVNVKMISQNIQFRVSRTLSVIFILLSWVANPFKLYKYIRLRFRYFK